LIGPEKILHIRSSYFYGGPERQITYLTRVLETMDVPSAVATFAPRNDPSRNACYTKLQALGIPCFKVEIEGSFDRSALPAMEKIVRDNGFTVVVGHDYRADYFALALRRRLGVPAFSFSRGWTRNSLRVRLYEWLDIRFLRRMDGVVAVSQAKFDELRRRKIEPSRLIHIPNSILTDTVLPRQNLIRDRFGIPHDALLVGTAGRLSIEKNQEVFIRAAVQVLETPAYERTWFILAGEGKRQQELAGLIPDKYRDRIILAGWIENNDAFYADLDLFVLTSLMEGFPNVLLEAGKYRLPVVTTRAGGAVDIVEDGVSGTLMPFGDATGLCQRLELLLGDEELRRTMGGELGKVTRERYNAEINAGRFLAFVRGVRERYGRD
jgi:glycosyltransferase involved in cell wall biosynthesis